jgi:hypothetical protein
MLEPAAERYFFTPRQTLKTAAFSGSWGMDPEEIPKDEKRPAIRQCA